MQSACIETTPATDLKDCHTSLPVPSCCLKHLPLGIRKKPMPWLLLHRGSFHLQVVAKQNPTKQDSRKLDKWRSCFAAEQHCRVKWRLQLVFRQSSKILCFTEPVFCRSLEVARQVKQLIAEINLTACWVHTEPELSMRASEQMGWARWMVWVIGKNTDTEKKPKEDRGKISAQSGTNSQSSWDFIQGLDEGQERSI